MSILQLLAQTNFITFNKIVAKELGVNEAILLGALCSYQIMYGEGEFYKEQELISEDTCLSTFQIREARKTLEDNGLLVTTRKGIPAKTHFQLLEDKISNFLISRCEKIKHLNNNNNIYSNIKEETNNNKQQQTLNDVDLPIKKKAFTPPTIEEVREYCDKRNNGISAEEWWHFYNARNWFSGKTKISKWKSAIITWEIKNKQNGKIKTQIGNVPRTVN